MNRRAAQSKNGPLFFFYTKFVGPGSYSLIFVEYPHEVVDIAEATKSADLRYAIAVLSKQLFSELQPFVVDIVYRSDPKLLLEPPEESVAAEVGLAAQIVDQYLAGEMHIDVVQYKLQSAGIV